MTNKTWTPHQISGYVAGSRSCEESTFKKFSPLEILKINTFNYDDENVDELSKFSIKTIQYSIGSEFEKITIIILFQ